MRALLTVLALLLGTLGAAAALSPAAEALAPVNNNHPYSDPVYLPLHAGFGVDCVRDNPGCASHHNFWAMDIVPAGQFYPTYRTSHAAVYAMGAGIVHIGVAHGSACGHGSSFGTWIWIDHGGGTVSRYGHLGAISVRNLQHVAAGQQIGIVGTTGKNKNCNVSYLDFMIEHRGLSDAHSVAIPQLRACEGYGRSELWPSQAAATYTPHGSKTTSQVHVNAWNSVHQNAQFPGSNASCLPANAPVTPWHATSLSVRPDGRGTVLAHWARSAALYHVQGALLEVAEWHGGHAHHWDVASRERWLGAPAGATWLRIPGLQRGRLYRVRVHLRAAGGWSSPSAFVNQTVR